MNPFFEAIKAANRAHCAAMGISAEELYGTPPSPQEFEVSALIAHGVPAESAFPLKPIVKEAANEPVRHLQAS